MQDLVKPDRSTVMIVGPSMALPQMRNGSIKIFAVRGQSPLGFVPEIPTVE